MGWGSGRWTCRPGHGDTCRGAEGGTKQAVVTASWGRPGNPWFFSASASNVKDRDALVAAFVDTAG